MRLAAAWTLSILYLPIRTVVLGLHWFHELIWDTDRKVGLWIYRLGRKP